MQYIENFKNKLLEKAKASGFESAEFFYQSSSSKKINIYEGKVEKNQTSSTGGFSFRGLYNGKMGNYYSEDINEDIIDTVIEGAKQNALLIENDDKEFIYSGGGEYAKINTYDADISDITAEELAEYAKTLEKAALNADSRVTKVLAATLSAGEAYISLGNTAGLDLNERSNYVIAYADCVAEENGETKENGEFGFYMYKKDIDPADIGRKAAEKTLAMLGADSVKTGEYDIIIQNEALGDLLDCFIGNFYGENVQKGFSMLKDRIGEKIADERLTLVDDPHMEGGMATCAFDSEGVPTRKNVLIENGVLKMFLHNLKSAAAAGEEPTGNGFKQSFKSTVGISATNIYIRSGDKTKNELLSELKNGLLITELSGLHAGANSISGDFSLLASGFEVKDGKITGPVEQITVADNFYTIINKVKSIGNDMKFNSGGVGAPSVLFEKISIAGK